MCGSAELRCGQVGNCDVKLCQVKFVGRSSFAHECIIVARGNMMR